MSHPTSHTEKYPHVSIVTPTRNRSIKLAAFNFLNIDYPPEKLEWIIVDDGFDNEKVIDQLPKDEERIKYYHFNQDMIQLIHLKFIEDYNNKKKTYKENKKEGKKPNKLVHKNGFIGRKLPIGLKRNMCVRYASHKYILHMDDDDYYPPSNVRVRIEALMRQEKEGKAECVGCKQIGGFHTKKYVSVMLDPPKDNIFVAPMGYTKSFWNKRKFNSQDMYNEGVDFLGKRKVKNVDSEEVIVSLFHKENQISVFDGKDPNGWHFNKISDELFLLITDSF